MPWQSVADLIWQLNSLAVVAVIVRLTVLGLAGKFRYFLADRVFTILLAATGLAVSTASAEYCAIYLYSRPFDLVLSLEAREVFHEVYRNNPGLAVLARDSRKAAMGIACLTALAGVPFTYPKWSCAEFQCAGFVFLEFQRATFLGIATYLMLTLYGLRRTSVTLDWNVRVHARLLALLLAVQVTVQTTALLTKGLGLLAPLNVLFMTCLCTLNLSWIALFREPAPAQVATVDSATAGAIEQRLRRLNELLARAAAPSTRGSRWIWRLIFETRRS